jgi:hypothetical protein
MNTNLPDIFKHWQESGECKVIYLMNKQKNVVGALHLDQLNFNLVGISLTNSDEKYLLYINGVTIFFTYYRKAELIEDGRET